MLVEMQIKILEDESSCIFSSSNEPFEKRPVMTMEDFVLHSNDHFESHLLGNGLYKRLVDHDAMGWRSSVSRIDKIVGLFCKRAL